MKQLNFLLTHSAANPPTPPLVTVLYFFGVSYFSFRSLESLMLSIRILLPAVCLVMRIVDIWTRKHDAIFGQRFGPLTRKVESLSRSKMAPCDRGSVCPLNGCCCQKLSGGAL